MHPNKIFHTKTEQENLQFAAERGFGTLAVNADGGPLIAHIPFVLTDGGRTLLAHVMRVNPINKLLDAPVDAVLAVTGADAYVSPDWYGVDDQVPTWNYVAVHLRGSLRRLKQDDLPGVLDALSAEMEGRLAPKKPWTSGKMDPAIYSAMQRGIVPIAMDIAKIDGTWKLSQNKPDAVRHAAADGVRAARIGSESEEAARLMRDSGARNADAG